MARKKNERPHDGDILPIRNSTAEFLTFVRDNGADTIAVRFQDEMLRLTVPALAKILNVQQRQSERIRASLRIKCGLRHRGSNKTGEGYFESLKSC